MQHRHALHNHEAHRRVFPGIDHAEQNEEEKRNDTPIAAQVVERDDSGEGVATVYSVVYVTASQTFDGDAASYSTATVDTSTAQPDQTSESTTSTSTPTMNADQSAYAAAKSSAANHRAPPASSSRTVLTTATAIPMSSSSAEDSTIDSASATSFLTSTSAVASSFESEATSSSALSGPVVGAISGGPPQATRQSSSETHMPQAIQQTSNGMSGGQQAGLAIGILAAFACAAGLLFFCWRKRKTLRRQKDGQEQLNEKHGSFFGSNQALPNGMASHRSSGSSDRVPTSVRSTRTASVAPRLSLRPVTQFLPNLTAGDRKSTGNTLAVAAAPVSEKSSAWERKPSNATEDPFADAAVLSEKEARPASSGSSDAKNPFEESNEKTAARSTTPTSDNGKELSSQSSDPPTPKSVKVGTASAVALGKAGPPAPTQPNNVHRVQLDFKPSMDDELELRSGQLVRILHEYDDGWALCIRMDRSQQGVCPRTCLSNLPVRPRAGPPPPGQRPPPGMRRPSNPNGPMYPRPLTPTNQGGNGPQGSRQRSATASKTPVISDATRNRSTSDAPKTVGVAASMPARKPVPGQAL